MKVWTLAMVAALAVVAAGCDRNSSPRATSPAAGASDRSDGAAGAARVGSSANAGAGNREDNRNGANPQQGQVDPNHAEQRRDFQREGDASGPQSADAQPRMGNR